MQPLASTASAAKAIDRVKYRHDAVIDIIIANPQVSQNELAHHFGFTTGWLSRVMCSDAFQMRLAQRRTEIVEPGLLATFEEKLKALADRSIEMLVDKLEEVDQETGKSAVSTDVIFKALDLSSKALGYGARQTNVAIQNNLTVNNISDEQLLQVAQGGSI